MRRALVTIILLCLVLAVPVQALTLEWALIDFHVFSADALGQWQPLAGAYVGAVDVETYQRFEGYTNGYGYWSTKVPAKRGYTWFVYPPLQYLGTCASVPGEPNCGYIYLHPQEYTGYTTHWVGVCTVKGGL